MRLTLTFIIISGISIPIITALKMKSVGVNGTVICDGKPVNDAWIELYSERNAGKSNAVLAKTKTNEQGHFMIKGSSKTDMFDPQFTISHKCRTKLCTRRVFLRIPDKYFTLSSEPYEMYDIGVVDMKKKFLTEIKTCPT
ncbi:unnamed protein product [Wuchereria bancrofti]|uniref:Transthyretin-like family protein n=2 Tax=Wuchereria bancrofti TaxID=6293 RepID=A0A183XHC9_WUCBA|nr:unnamed protein product [Wuchereria bancrofti]